MCHKIGPDHQGQVMYTKGTTSGEKRKKSSICGVCNWLYLLLLDNIGNLYNTEKEGKYCWFS
jgi:hypothetical protein